MSTNETSPPELFTREFTQNPYPVYEKLRQNDPIHRVLFPHGDFGWIISRYEDAVEVLKDNRFSKDVVKRYGAD